MLKSRNRSLHTPLMLALAQDRIEMFIYVLHSFETYFLNGGLECIDIVGDSLLHLAARKHAHRNSAHFAKIIQKFSSKEFIKLLNLQNNKGFTPIFVAVEERNLHQMKYLMTNPIQVPNLSVKNKDGETVKEFMERSMHNNPGSEPDGGRESLDIPDAKEPAQKYYDVNQFRRKYQKYESRLLLQAMIGVTGQDGDCLENEIRIKNLELSPLKAFRIIFKN